MHLATVTLCVPWTHVCVWMCTCEQSCSCTVINLCCKELTRVILVMSNGSDFPRLNGIMMSACFSKPCHGEWMSCVGRREHPRLQLHFSQRSLVSPAGSLRKVCSVLDANSLISSSTHGTGKPRDLVRVDERWNKFKYERLLQVNFQHAENII